MRWKPVVVQSERSDGSLVVRVGHPLADAYLEFLRARARPNTIRAVAFDLKVFFSFVDKTPTRVTSVDVMAFITAQRNGDGGGKVVSIDRSEGLSPRTIRRRLSSVSGFYAYLMVRDDTSVSRNPVPRGTLAIIIPIGIVDAAFFAANLPKIPTGGWFPLLVGLLLVLMMTTWRRGRQLVAGHIRRGETPIGDVVEHALDTHVARVPGTAVYMFKDAGVGPPALMSNLRHNKILHQHTLLVAVHTTDTPRVSKLHRATNSRIGPGIHQVDLYFGFMEQPIVPAALSLLDIPGFRFDAHDTTYFLGRELVTVTQTPGMHPLRERLFAAMNRSSAGAARFFSLPSEQVFEVGTQVDI